MLKNIQKYDILHSIIDDCRQKILKLAERPQGDMNMFKKVGLGFLFVQGMNYDIDFAGGTMLQIDMETDASVKASVLWPVFIGICAIMLIFTVLLFAANQKLNSLVEGEE